MQAVKHFIETFVPEHYDLFLDLNRADKIFRQGDHYWGS